MQIKKLESEILKKDKPRESLRREDLITNLWLRIFYD